MASVYELELDGCMSMEDSDAPGADMVYSRWQSGFYSGEYNDGVSGSAKWVIGTSLASMGETESFFPFV